MLSPRLSDEDYKFVYERVVRLCLDFVIVRNGRLLLAQRDIEPCKGYWAFPGGMIRRQEAVDAAAERILLSEIGLKPSSKKLIGYIEFPDEVNQNGIHIHSISMVFLVTLPEGEVQGSAQARNVQFFESLPEKTQPQQKKFLQDNWNAIKKESPEISWI